MVPDGSFLVLINHPAHSEGSLKDLCVESLSHHASSLAIASLVTAYFIGIKALKPSLLMTLNCYVDIIDVRKKMKSADLMDKKTFFSKNIIFIGVTSEGNRMRISVFKRRRGALCRPTVYISSVFILSCLCFTVSLAVIFHSNSS